MLKITRTFHPIGHGAFYTEQFVSNETKFTMVYDCGGTKIKDKIDKVFIKGQNIDLVFISHFHNDHINGLEYLLKEFNVKRVILPLLHDSQKIELFLSNQEASSFAQNICLNPKNIILEYSKFKEVKVTFVKSETLKDSNSSGKEPSIDISNIGSEIKSGKVLTISKISDWIYIPFNFDYKVRNEEFLEELNKKGISVTIDTFKDIYDKKKKEIKEIYDSIGDLKKRNININSLVVYSGINTNTIKYKTSRSNFKIYTYSRYRKTVGCIYMGDYNAKDNYLPFEKKIKVYFKYLSVIQIPHHGSIENYSSKLNCKDKLFSIISAPKKNSAGHHPNPIVISKIALNKGIPLIVTEEDVSKVIQEIKLN